MFLVYNNIPHRQAASNTVHVVRFLAFKDIPSINANIACFHRF